MSNSGHSTGYQRERKELRTILYEDQLKKLLVFELQKRLKTDMRAGIRVFECHVVVTTAILLGPRGQSYKQ